MEVTSVVVTADAYTKLFLHCSKYTEAPVLGYLLGTKTGSQVTVEEIVPVCHSSPASTILEFGAAMTERFAFDLEKTLLGVYYGSAQLEAPTGIAATTPPYVIALVENLKRITGKDKVLVTVINSLFGDSDKTFLKAAVNDRVITCKTLDGLSVMNKMLTKALDNNLHRHFSDIEDHMNSTAKAEDPQSFPELLDFRNKFVNEFVNK